jgi:hypothetical protein
MVLQIADLGGKALFESLEMDLGYLGVLAVARFSGLDKDRIAEAKRKEHPIPFNPQEYDQWAYGDERYRNLSRNLRLHGPDNGRTLHDVLTNACKHGFDVVAVDHVGMMDRDSGNEMQVLNRNIDHLRALSHREINKHYGPWVIATSQFNREIEKSPGERDPRLSDFRAAARIEHDADVAIGLKKTKLADLDSESSMFGIEAHVLKNRFGPSPLMILYGVNGQTNGIEEQIKTPPPQKQRVPKQQKLPMNPINKSEEEEHEHD